MKPREQRSETSNERRKGNADMYLNHLREYFMKDDNLYEFLLHIFLLILLLFVIADILVKLAVPVLDNPDSILSLSGGDILRNIQDYGVEFNPCSKTIYAMLLTACVYGSYSTLEFIRTIKNKDRISLTSNLARILAILSIYLVLYLSYKRSTESRSELFVLSIIFVIYYVLVLYKYVVKGLVSNITKDHKTKDFKAKDIYAFLLVPFLVLLFSFCLLFPMQVTHYDHYPFHHRFLLLQREDFNLYLLKRLLLSLIVFVPTSYMISEFIGRRIKSNVIKLHYLNSGIFPYCAPILYCASTIQMISEPIGRESQEKTDNKRSNIVKYVINEFGGHLINEAKDSVKHHHLKWEIFFYSLFMYVIVWLFFVEIEFHTGMLALLIIAILISVGFSISGYIMSKIWDTNSEILKLIRPDGINEGKNKENLIEELRKHISDLWLDFLIAISSYVFLSALLKTRLPESLPLSSQNLELLLSDLNLILFIPLYLFLIRAGSAIARNIYEEMYDRREKAKGISHNIERKDSFVKVFVTLTKVVIVIFIIFHIFMKFEISGSIKDFVSTSPFNYMIELAIAIPITMQVLVLILDPFFERETIEVGSNIGKIKDVGFFFTKMETVTGEHVYIPNAELIARTIKRLNARIPENEVNQKRESFQGEIDKEKGIMIHFSCTLNYNHQIKDIKPLFEGLFQDNNRENLRQHLKDIGYEVTKKHLDFIFSKELSNPFVFIEDFKDHGVVYRFNFRVRNALYAPFIRGYFMRKFKEKMEGEEREIYTPIKFEITNMTSKMKVRREKTEEES